MEIRLKMNIQNMKKFNNLTLAQGVSLTLTIGMLLIVAVIVFLFARGLIVSEVLPELDKKSHVIGKTILNPIERALKLGLNVRTLRGVDDYFNAAKQDNPEIISLGLVDVDGNPLYKSSGPTSQKTMAPDDFYLAKVPFKSDDTIAGYLNIGINLDTVKKAYRDSVYDLFVIIFVSLVIAFEVLIFVFRYRITEPITGLLRLIKQVGNGKYQEDLRLWTKDEIGLFSQSLSKLIKKTSNLFHRVKSRIEVYVIMHEEQGEKVTQLISTLEKKNKFSIPLSHIILSNIFYIRLPLFLFVFSESLSSSFIPLYSRQLLPGSITASAILIALPLVSFMFSYALSQPLSGYWAQITNRRYVFLSGGIVYCAGILGAAFSSTLFEFIFWRFVSGFGFGFFLIACQAFIIDFMRPRKKVQTMAMFMGGYYAAAVCGTPIGALFAEGVGYRNTFLIAFFSALISVLYTQIYLKFSITTGKEAAQRVSFISFVNILKNSEFVRFLSLIAIPSRILMSACILYAMPVYLKSMSYSTSLIGRVLMIYSLMIYALGYLISKYVDHKNNALSIILLGSLITTCSSFVLLFSSSFHALLLFVLLFGLGHSLSLTPQVTIPSMLSEENSAMTLSVYRLFEIMGFAIGPFIMGVLMEYIPPQFAMISLSAPAALFIIIYAATSFRKTNITIQSRF